MKQTLFDIWHDPVWSKVIAGIILTIIYNWVWAKIKSKKFIDSFIEFWTYRIQLWIYTIPLILFFTLNRLVASLGIWNFFISVGSFVFLLILFWKLNKLAPKYMPPSVGINPIVAEPVKEETKFKVFFKSESANKYSFVGNVAHNYENNQRVGKIAEGSFEFKDGILNIDRQNIDGQYAIKIVNFIAIGNGSTTYIERDISGVSFRTIQIIFSARTLNGTHLLWFFATKPNETSWINNANVNQRISTDAWKEYNLHFRIPTTEDFELHFSDRDVQKAPSSVQIKGLIIQEVL